MNNLLKSEFICLMCAAEQIVDNNKQLIFCDNK